MQTFIETPRLLIREIVPEDEAGMFELDSDAEVHRYLGNIPVTDIAQIREVIAFIRQQYIDNGIGRWAMEEKATGQFIGWTGLKLETRTVNGYSNFYDLGYRLIRRCWGLGYATEGAKASLHYGFEQMGLTAVYGRADVANVASRQVLLKCGLRHTGTFEDDGTPTDWFCAVR